MFSDLFDQYSAHTLFLCDDGTSVSYNVPLEFQAQPAVRETSRQLVFCLCNNSPGALTGYLGFMCAKAVPLMLNDAIAPDQLARLIDCYQPAYFWLPQSRAHEIAHARRLLDHMDYTLLAADPAPACDMPDALALLISTSGSTGSPKMVRLSQQNLIANAQSIAEYLQLTVNERPVTTLPPGYSYGLSILHSHLTQGCTIALTQRSLVDRGFWGFIKEAGATSMGGVPYHYEMLRKLRFSKMDLPSLRTLTQAGGRLDPALAVEFATLCAQRNMRFFIMYGQAEATARMAWLAPEKALSKPSSIGQPIPGGAFWLEDEHGQKITAPGVQGELVYAGKNVSMGYAENKAELALGDERQGILRTGDVARQDADGDYYIVGRLKRFLKLFGHRFNLADIEAQLQGMGFTSACSGCDDHLDIYLCDGSREAALSMKEWLVNHMRINPACLRIMKVSELPRTDAGKIHYAALAELDAEILA